MEKESVLFSRLRDKGLTPVEIKRIIKDSLIIFQKGISDRAGINRELKYLGRKSNLLDETTYQLILF